MNEPGELTDDARRERLLTLQLVYSWAAGAVTRTDREPVEEPGLRRTADYCLRMIEQLDPDRSLRNRSGFAASRGALITSPRHELQGRPTSEPAGPRLVQ